MILEPKKIKSVLLSKSLLVSHFIYSTVYQKVAVRTGHGTKDLFQTGKGVPQGCILSACLFNFYAEYIMQNAGLDESQAGIKIDEVERGE